MRNSFSPVSGLSKIHLYSRNYYIQKVDSSLSPFFSYYSRSFCLQLHRLIYAVLFTDRRRRYKNKKIKRPHRSHHLSRYRRNEGARGLHISAEISLSSPRLISASIPAGRLFRRSFYDRRCRRSSNTLYTHDDTVSMSRSSERAAQPNGPGEMAGACIENPREEAPGRGRVGSDASESLARRRRRHIVDRIGEERASSGEDCRLFRSRRLDDCQTA